MILPWGKQEPSFIFFQHTINRFFKRKSLPLRRNRTRRLTLESHGLYSSANNLMRNHYTYLKSMMSLWLQIWEHFVTTLLNFMTQSTPRNTLSINIPTHRVLITSRLWSKVLIVYQPIKGFIEFARSICIDERFRNRFKILHVIHFGRPWAALDILSSHSCAGSQPQEFGFYRASLGISSSWCMWNIRALHLLINYSRNSKNTF